MSSRALIELQNGDPAAPKSHARLELGRWRAIFKHTTQKLIRDRVSLSAGSLAYHWFLALFPAVIAVLGVLSLVRVNQHDLANLTHGIEKGLYAFEWGELVRILGGFGRDGQVTPPA